MPVDFVQQFEEQDDKKVKLNPMTPLAASSTVINLLLATGPFSYPYSYVNAGPIFSCIIIGFTSFLAYISATYMIEAIAISQTHDGKDPEERGRTESLFGNDCYKTPEMQRRTNDPDSAIKNSPYYIRQKMELGTMA